MTDEQFYTFDSLGLVIARGALPTDTVRKANEIIDRALEARPIAKFSIMELDPLFVEFMARPWVMQACCRALGRHFRFDHAFGLEQPTATPNLHGGPQACQSSCFYHGSANPDSNAWIGRLSVGFALTGQSPQTGGFVYVPGSHKSNDLRPGSRVLAELFQGRFDHPALTIPTLEPGDACIFPDSLVHGTSPGCDSFTRRALYYMYSPGFMAWRPYGEIEKYLPLARTPLQRRLLRPPYVAHYREEGHLVGDNRWREPTL